MFIGQQSEKPALNVVYLPKELQIKYQFGIYLSSMNKFTASTAAIMIFGMFLHTGYAQTSISELEPEAYFDFWLGTWELTWEDADGTTAHGTNTIERVLDGKVIKENFEAHSGAYKGFTGKSYSVYQPRFGTWKQTWVDNQGGYLDFVGQFDGDKRIFKRTGTNAQGKAILQRMTFYDISEDSLTWDWEISEDNGQTWQLRWRIFYERAE